MMDIRKLKELVRLMVENDLTELDLRDKDEQATVRRQTTFAPPQVIHQSTAASSTHSQSAGTAAKSGHKSGHKSGQKSDQDESDLVAIECPMVGTFYSSSGPDKPSFISVGGSVDSDTVVCLIEAMKIFNEIKAECSGTIVKVLVKSGQAVEFGQKLFLVRPA